MQTSVLLGQSYQQGNLIAYYLPKLSLPWAKMALLSQEKIKTKDSDATGSLVPMELMVRIEPTIGSFFLIAVGRILLNPIK